MITSRFITSIVVINATLLAQGTGRSSQTSPSRTKNAQSKASTVNETPEHAFAARRVATEHVRCDGILELTHRFEGQYAFCKPGSWTKCVQLLDAPDLAALERLAVSLSFRGPLHDILAGKQECELATSTAKMRLDHVDECLAVYNKTIDKKISDLTTRDVDSVAACKAAELYPPQKDAAETK